MNKYILIIGFYLIGLYYLAMYHQHSCNAYSETKGLVSEYSFLTGCNLLIDGHNISKATYEAFERAKAFKPKQ